MSENAVQGVGYVGEVSAPYAITSEGDWVKFQFKVTEESVWVFRIPARDFEYFATQLAKNKGGAP